ncbi:EAL domain-containing protein [Pseudarthrobacter sp. RMG13]|uniref:EAL domain-containing protein n=1 Tax=Pseudarthrobacter humi TaxID=2952523 RepID=A0ABT1LLR0_9MICC|nr:EAL domain-containing protein [Pseudarthrobacter humi]MCP8998136.1 EAL domain-containing protein [Pseudarthrobacter humi]
MINDVLTDPDPEGEWARSQLRNHLASHPDEPERALLEHLMGTRELSGPKHRLAAPAGPVVTERLSAPVLQPGAQAGGIRKRIQSVLGNRLLLTALQPVYELPGGRITGFEALTRFVSSDGKDADTWFREAEAVGLGPELEIAALECAMSAAQGIPPHLFVAFNLSPASLADIRVQGMLENCGLAMDKIIIELIGRASDEIWSSLIQALVPFRKCGLRVAVDGSGKGFTPAEQVLSLRPDIIKLDRTVIDGILLGTERDEPAVIGLANEVGAVLAAEGIETETELAAVIELGMTAGQGFLLGRPSVDPLEWSAWVVQAEAAPAEP